MIFTDWLRQIFQKDDGQGNAADYDKRFGSLSGVGGGVDLDNANTEATTDITEDASITEEPIVGEFEEVGAMDDTTFDEIDEADTVTEDPEVTESDISEVPQDEPVEEAPEPAPVPVAVATDDIAQTTEGGPDDYEGGPDDPSYSGFPPGGDPTYGGFPDGSTSYGGFPEGSDYATPTDSSDSVQGGVVSNRDDRDGYTEGQAGDGAGMAAGSGAGTTDSDNSQTDPLSINNENGGSSTTS